MDLPAPVDAATVASGLQASDITAIAGVFVAACALFITIWQAWFTKKQSIIMVKPFINLTPSNHSSQNEKKYSFSIKIENMGQGPAVINKISYLVNKEDKFNGFGTKALSSIGITPDYCILSTFDFLDTIVLGSQNSMNLISITTLIQHEPKVRALLDKIDILVEYTDIYNTPQKAINTLELKEKLATQFKDIKEKLATQAL